MQSWMWMIPPTMILQLRPERVKQRLEHLGRLLVFEVKVGDFQFLGDCPPTKGPFHPEAAKPHPAEELVLGLPRSFPFALAARTAERVSENRHVPIGEQRSGSIPRFPGIRV